MPSSVKDMLAAANAAVPKISPQDAAALVKGGNVLVVDVRDGTELLAITGNVLNGESDLMHTDINVPNLNRRSPPAANNWHLYNADPN